MTKHISPALLSGLIGSIYDCALDSSRWEATLSEIVDAVDGFTGILALADVPQQRLLIYRQIGIEPHYEALLLKHQNEVNAELARNLAAWPSLDMPYHLTRHTTEEERAASPYIQECVSAGGVVDILQFFLITTGTRYSSVAFTRHGDVGNFTDHEIKFLGLLLPHLRRAVAISDVLDVATVAHESMRQTLDVVRCAVVLTDERGTILHANQQAQEMLGAGHLIHSAGGALRGRNSRPATELRLALAQTTVPHSMDKDGLAVLLTEEAGDPVFAHVLPLGAGDPRARLHPGATAAIFINAAPDNQAAVELVASAYGLTLTEQRVLGRLLAGSSLVRVAEELGVAQTTAKTHLEGIFAKTGANRQADLILLAARARRP